MTTFADHPTGTDFSFQSQNKDNQSTELCPTNNDMGTVYNGSLSLFPTPSNGSLISTRESASPIIAYDCSSFSRQKPSDSVDSTGNDGNISMSFLDQKLGKSRPNIYTHENSFADTAKQPWLNKEPNSQSSLDVLLGGNINSYKQSSLDKSFDKKWEYSRDTPSYSFDTLNRTSETTNKQKYDQFSTIDLSQSKSQTFDFELMKQTYSFDASKSTSKPVEKQTDGTKANLNSRQSLDFDNSDIAIRLRTSLQSDFLSSELRHDVSPKQEDTKFESSSALRTIEEILKQYGISDNPPTKNTPTLDDAGNKFATASQVGGQSNLSQNNEMLSSLSRTTSTPYSSTPDKDASNMFPISANNNINSLFRNDLKVNTSYLDSKNSTNHNTSFSVNVSQNNEATNVSQSNADSDPLRKSGSSVDYTSSGKMVPFSGGTSFKMFDYGKPSTFSGDTPRASCNPYSCKDTKQFEASIDKIKFEGSQVDVGKPAFNLSKSTPLDIIKNMGSATDALEYSMSTERQRLRKIDTMISATPFNYSSADIPKSIRAQYMSPERSYSSLRASDLTGIRMFSGSTGPSSSGQSSGASHKNNFVGNVSQRESSAALNKSISAPGSGLLNVKGDGKYDSSVDGRTPYWSYSSSNKDYNMQHNNAYNPQLLEKMAGQKANNKNQKKPLVNKKKDCPVKGKKDSTESFNFNVNDIHSFYPQSTSGISFLNSARMDKNIPIDRKRCSKKPETKKCTDGKKNSKTDLNHSKNVGNIPDGFDFVKDLNRMWKDTVFGSAPTAKPGHNQKTQKYTPYKPVMAARDKKEEKPQKGSQFVREMLNNDLLQSSARRSDSNWTVTGSISSGGKYNKFDTDLGFNSAQRIRSQCSLAPQQSTQHNSKLTSSSLAKHKTNMSSGLTTKNRPSAPKSILKQPSNKSTGSISSSMSRPHSAMVTASKSYTQSAYQMPYHLVRGFSPVDMNKTARSFLTPAKKPDSSTKRKPVSRVAAPPKQGRRV